MSRFAGRVVALVVCAATVAFAPGRAMAHTDLDFSLPANGTTVGEPVEEISVGFTDQVALVGNGFEVHDPQGNVLTPFVVTDDNKVFRFQLDPPLAGGVVTVDYHVRALDGDVQEGSFSFTVAAPLVTSTSTSTVIGSAATIATTGTDVMTIVSAAVGAETAPSAPTTTPSTTTATSTATTAASTLPSDGSDDNERTLMFVVLLGIAAASAGFLVLRSRRPA